MTDTPPPVGLTESEASIADSLGQLVTMALAPESGAADLIGAIMAQNARDAMFATNALLERYQADADRLRAELFAVRRGISHLLRGPWMPTSDALLRSLWPTPEEIADAQDFDGEP